MLNGSGEHVSPLVSVSAIAEEKEVRGRESFRRKGEEDYGFRQEVRRCASKIYAHLAGVPPTYEKPLSLEPTHPEGEFTNCRNIPARK